MESLGKNVFFNDTSWTLEFVSPHNLNIAWLEKMLDFLKPFIKGKHFAVRNRGKFDFDHHFAFWLSSFKDRIFCFAESFSTRR